MITRTDSTSFFSLILFFTFFAFPLLGQHNKIQLKARAGITTGSPIVLKNIPEGATGSPGIGLNAGLTVAYRFHPKLSFNLGAAYAEKGSTFSSPVSGKYDAARGVFGERFPFPLRVNYTGNVDAGFDMTYIDFPAIANIHLNKWWFGLGYQYSKMLNGTLDGEVDVKALLLKFNDQAFDDSENIKNYDHAAILQIGRQLFDRLTISTDFTVSGQRLMIEAEEGFSNPRNVFVNVLVGFRIF